MNKKRVLVFPCGTEIGLEINRALSGSIHFDMVGASSVADHGKYVYKEYLEGVPFVDSLDFIPAIKQICQKHHIDFIFPAHDSVVLKLAQHQQELPAPVITSPLSTCEIARSKRKTYEVLQGVVPCPKVYQQGEQPSSFPVFAKPDVGQGSKGARKINSASELEDAYCQQDILIVTEFLPGEEYTVDCFTNARGELLFVGARQRLRINNGISVRTAPVKDAVLEELATKINGALSFNGMWFFQVKKNKSGEYVLLELAPRIAGTMGLYRALGVNFAQLALYNAMGIKVNVLCNHFNLEMDRALYASYKTDLQYSYVYIDFDDTLVLNGRLNTKAIQFLYQAFNERKKIILITKHVYDIHDTLQKCALAENLFAQIIHLKPNEEKSPYITEKDAIFIDDSYSERMRVACQCSIPVFGIDALDVLIHNEN